MKPLGAFTIREAELDGQRREAAVGIVGAQGQAVLGTAGEHAVGLGHAARDEVVDHDAEIGLAAVEDERVAALGG